MIRFAWRQFRTQALVGFSALVVVAVLLAITWPHVSHLADASPRPPLTAFYEFLSGGLDILMIAVPALIGVFWGAPLVSRELETGSVLLAWTQSVTRTRWLAIKLGVVGLCALILSGLFSLVVSWWSHPIDQLNMDRFSSLVFAQRGIAPLGYAAFALALGVTAGVIIRRTQPAMVATLAVFGALRVAITYWVRPYLAGPAHISFDLSSDAVALGLYPAESTVKAFVAMPNALIRSTQILDSTGHGLTSQAMAQAFPSLAAGGHSMGTGEVEAGFTKLAETYHVLLTYQPADRYWAFQAGETAIFLLLAIALGALCFWWVRRRLS
jgi:hypothetical protein